MNSNVVGVLKWQIKDGISETICDELSMLGYEPIPFLFDAQIPATAFSIFSFGPYGDFLHVPRQLARLPYQNRPVFIQWNTEGLPDPRIPARVIRLLGYFRTKLNNQLTIKSNGWMATRMLRYRYVGDYYYAVKSGWLDVFADTSTVYSQWHETQGLQTVYAPWGSTPRWYDELNIPRDIDVLWMGNRSSRRRHYLLNRLQEDLEERGVSFYLADNIANPFLFDETRTHFLNRAKITLNLTRTWYDDNYSRFSMATSNRSLVVSEPLLPHCPDYVAGEHFVSAPIEQLADTIVYYLKNAEKRRYIVENAYRLVTSKLTMSNSIQAIMNEAERMRCEKLNGREICYG